MTVPHAWQNSDFAKRAEITVPTPDANVSAFPFPVILDGLGITDTDIVQDEWCFYDKDDNLLPWDRDTYAEGGGTCTGVIHAHLDLYSAPSGEQNHLFFYYKKVSGSTPANTPSDVWDANFNGVWHMNDEQDSTTNNKDITWMGGALPNAQTGIIGNSQRANYSSCAKVYVAQGTPVTVEAWMKFDDDWASGICGYDDGGAGWSNQIARNADNICFYLWDGGGRTVDSGVSPDAGVWYHIVGQAETGQTMTLWVNGTAYTGVTLGTVWSGGNNWRFGYSTLNGNYLLGHMDECRISSVMRSAAWVKHTFTVVNTGLTYGSIEDKPAAGFAFPDRHQMDGGLNLHHGGMTS